MLGKRAIVLCAIGIVLVGVTYIVGLRPFQKAGEIKAVDACATLGDPSRAVAALRAVVPEHASYAFDDNVPDPRRDSMDSSYLTTCFIYGDGQQLGWAEAEMTEYDHPSGWIEEVVEQYDSASSLTPFTAGDKAVASPRVAAVYLPCTSHGSQRHLSVVVHLKQPGDADGTVLRSHLIVLAKNAAVFAHRKARCDRGAVG
ncbi:hypothetical protein CTU88_42575 [Streptomyces sp. JV178]|uniref:hypothetical protein n=1 Tax=Streptomyces sp. JV178 TaxID=858632 RepID=UPI000C1B58A9|nr:hypothetical protein [Streptomyces sp. JV178]PIM66279.1 hypothetical protein CTU88_42575 [Streptomyces sp. JV178]